MSVIKHCFLPYNFNKMKTLLRISAFVSLLLMISMAGFSQGWCGMKFVPHNPPSPLDPPFNAIYYIWDITTAQTVTADPVLGVSPTQENDHQFTTVTTLTSTDYYLFVVSVQDQTGHYGTGGSAAFTGAQYNQGGSNFKEDVNVIYL